MQLVFKSSGGKRFLILQRFCSFLQMESTNVYTRNISKLIVLETVKIMQEF